jgi:NAD(P)-dependent dehydrogenase (short-subunit alcohol dehydrogenase family)
MQGLKGKVALVTGAASGIGRGCAAALAREGASVLIADIDDAGAAQTREQIADAGGRAEVLRLDVASEAAWADQMAAVEARHGALHILVNNAAICVAAPVLEMTFATWRRQLSINLDSVFLGTRAAIPLMTASGGGSIVNISSVAGLKGIAGLSGYCASKGGVRLFTKAAALECAQSGANIRINSIHPGGIETPIWVKMANDGVPPDPGANSAAEAMERAREATARATPLGFAGAPEDIAEAVLYLCSDGARFVTGAELVVDGGVFAG